jgi:hypothetical protein
VSGQGQGVAGPLCRHGDHPAAATRRPQGDQPSRDTIFDPPSIILYHIELNDLE